MFLNIESQMMIPLTLTLSLTDKTLEWNELFMDCSSDFLARLNSVPAVQAEKCWANILMD